MSLKDVSEHKTKIYKYLTSISKNEYINKLDDIVNEYNDTYHRTIKMKPVDVKDNTYLGSMELSCSNDEDRKFKFGDHVRISKYKNKGYTPNCSDEVFVMKKVKNTVPLTYVNDEIIVTCYEREVQKTNQQAFGIEKVIKRKGDKLYVKMERL